MAFDRREYEVPTDLTVQPEDLPDGARTAPVSDPAPKPPQNRGQTSDKRRDPDKPPGTEGYEDDVPTRPRGGAEGRTETKAPVVEKTTNEEIEDLRKEVQRLKTLMGETPEGRRQAESERRAQERVDALTTTAPFGELGRPRTKGELQDFNPVLGLMKVSEMLGGPEFVMPTERYRQQARQSTGGFIQEVQPPAEPKTREGEIITPQMSIERLNTRIRERDQRLKDLGKEKYQQDKISLRGAPGIMSDSPVNIQNEPLSETDSIRQVGATRSRMLRSDMDRIRKEIEALKTLRDEIQASVAEDAAE